jgi:adenylylsulfate kinase-like enzyme
MIYWFTGQPGHGKTVLAKTLNEKYFKNKAFHVDGDDLREIFDNKDYSEVGRRKNIELAQHISHFLNNKGENVIVSLVSPYKDQRDI